MSIQSEIERLNLIKERIRTNLVAQGLAVPADAVLADMAEQILSVAGEDGVSVTHSWDGTVLTITSASGTSSVDLKGEPGDPASTADSVSILEIGDFTDRTIADLRNTLDGWLNEYYPNSAKCQFSAHKSFIDLWNANDLTTEIQAGSRWTCETIGTYVDNDYAMILMASYMHENAYLLMKCDGEWRNVIVLASDKYLSDNYLTKQYIWDYYPDYTYVSDNYLKKENVETYIISIDWDDMSGRYVTDNTAEEVYNAVMNGKTVFCRDDQYKSTLICIDASVSDSYHTATFVLTYIAARQLITVEKFVLADSADGTTVNHDTASTITTSGGTINGDVEISTMLSIKNGDGGMNFYTNGIEGQNGMWIDVNGEAWYKKLYIGSGDNAKQVATIEDINTAIASITNADEVSY